MATVALSAEQKILAGSKSTLRGQIGSMFAGFVSNVDNEIADVKDLITSNGGEISRVENKFDGEISRMDGRIDSALEIMSTDQERIDAVNQLLAGYQAADDTLQGLLEAAIDLKADKTYVDGKVSDLEDAAAANLSEAKIYTDTKDAARKVYVDNEVAGLKSYADSTFVTKTGLDAALGTLAEMGL